MVYEATLTTENEIDAKAGASASSDVTTDQKSAFAEQAESFVISVCRFNFVDEYDNLTNEAKKILNEVVSNLAAMYVIQYDMGGYTSRSEAQTMLDVLRDGAFRGISLLRDKKTQTFMKND